MGASLKMRGLVLLSFVTLCLILPVVRTFFFGPTAVALGVGLLAAGGGFLLGASLSRSRTRRSYRQSRSYSYSASHHYDTSYNSWYSRPQQNYYYSSERWERRRGKRDVGELEELARMKRDIDENGFNMNDWYRDMTEMDQDSCGKKLICELSSKQASGMTLTAHEQLIAEKFGSRKQVDVSDITVEFDLAGQIGRNMGTSRCQQLYNRCQSSTEDMVKMIQIEFEDLQKLQKDVENHIEVEEQAEKERQDLLKTFKENKVDLDENWQWA